MKAGILLGRRTHEAAKVARAAQAAFHRAGASCSLGELPPSQMGERFFDGLDVLLAIGGDGTILSATRRAARMEIPVLGVNLGRVGFLSELEPERVASGVERLVAKEYRIERRLMLKASIGEKSWFALNDICVVGKRRGKVIRVAIHINGRFYDKLACDGVLAASPTGSTAYSLSCGGPVLMPDLRAILLAAICPHTIRHRHMVLGEQEELLFEVLPGYGGAVLLADGQEEAQLEPGNARIAIARAPFDAQMIRFEAGDFFSLVRSKLAD